MLPCAPASRRPYTLGSVGGSRKERRQGTASIPARESSGKTVVVVDDDLATCNLIGRALGLHGWTVEASTSPEAALQLFYSREPQAAVIDIALGETDGFAMARAFRKIIPATPLIMISSAVSRRMALNVFLGSPAPFFLPKPLDVEALARLLERLHTASSRQAAPTR